jgi:histidyl-tRNA synthetase
MCAIGIERFRIRINNRQILSGLLDTLGLKDRSTVVLRALDKLDKIGVEGVGKELAASGVSELSVAKLFDFATVRGGHEQVLERLKALLGESALAMEGIERLQVVCGALIAAGVPSERFEIDVSIARGLDYYTGIIFETTLLDLPQIGSVCSGGRYDNLAGLFTKQSLPGIGASLGLDRLLAALEKLEMLPGGVQGADVFIPLFDPDHINDYFAIAALVRSVGFSAEVYPEPKKLGAQLKYADGRGCRLALIAGSREFSQGVVQVKDLRSQVSVELPLGSSDRSEFLDRLRGLLSLDRLVATK